ncbi:isoprenylcysteine carboxylmethyltransferase family protein [Actinotalea sp. K2]|uniref:methyltransferase family protein n=1 Tax=Actinotalea sp. K2 TaxID=2939438 RepID=UPI002016F249|nr:isoprenylcysteine carboxylmethyltransferase family protein [Actinotalea sp. K2]MCL3862790.1 isoprenylcysteine carboxylmethyltransferase family protein [Actinotalea sp. K2]
MQAADRIIAAQAVSLAALAWPGRPRWDLPRSLALLAAAATAGGATFSVHGARPHGRLLTPRVDPPSEATLLSRGPYAISRHPVYTGLLVAAAGVATLRRRPEPAIAWVALAVVLTIKTGREEQRLVARFGEDYVRYRERTRRFL